ncbi:hypothetical protein BH11BAC2_BH11BAC2_17060 [soil metagenome]
MLKNYFINGLLFLILCCTTHLNAQQSSLLFDGVNDKVTVPASAAFNSPNTLTLEAWINASVWKAQSFQGTIIGKDNTNTSGYVLRCGSNGKLSFTVGISSTWTEVVSNPIMQTNIWYHVTAVFDNGTLLIYINGNLEGTTTTAGMAPITNSTVGMLIGESSGYAGRVFQGFIDEVRVWNVARTQSEIIANDTVNLPNNEPGLVAYYKFNQLTGITTPNEITATTNSIGTLVNFPANPWGPGYSIGGADLNANAVISPDRITFYSGSSRVRASFTNNGTDTISNFTVGYQLNGGTPVIETITQSLPPNQKLIYAFNNVVEASIVPTSTLKVFCNLSNDYNPLNDTATYVYIKPTGNNNTIPLFSAVRHDFGANGQSHLATVPLPDENTKYSQIIMNISVSCPPSGCDPWDQPAKISLAKDGQTYELARFITPYGMGCGPWTVDVTSFKSLLTGACNFESYIQVWGQNGWLLNVSLTFVEAGIAFPYQKVTRLWETDNWVYGDPGISYDLPQDTITTNSLTQELELRMTNSGHGQANTDNAAEFSQKTHTFVVNNANVGTQYLWKANCAQNTCANQAGTWLYNRAGWCPGQAVDPYFLNLTPQLTPGSDILIDYVLQPYTNLLNTGYNGGSHTEPHYKIHAFLVEKSNQYIDGTSYINAAATKITYPLTDADLTTSTLVKVMIYNTGTTVITQPTIYYFVNGGQSAAETPTLTINPGDSLEYTFSTVSNFTAGQEVHLAALVAALGDQASSDDVASVVINSTVGIEENNAGKEITIYPNPSSGAFTVKFASATGNSEIAIVDMIGKTVYQTSPIKDQLNLGVTISQRFDAGTYLIVIKTNSGIYYQKLIIN